MCRGIGSCVCLCRRVWRAVGSSTACADGSILLPPPARDGGICVDLGFFKDVVIPPHGLPEPSDWDEQDEARRAAACATSHRAATLRQLTCPLGVTALQAWRWQMGDQDLYFELGLPLRFKVQSVRFNPVPTLATQQQQQQEGRAVEGTSERPYAPMEVVGRVDDDGLGMVHWYAAEAED